MPTDEQTERYVSKAVIALVVFPTLVVVIHTLFFPLLLFLSALLPSWEALGVVIAIFSIFFSVFASAAIVRLIWPRRPAA
jgi:hypothetical protein